jgi:hypothetical protein
MEHFDANVFRREIEWLLPIEHAGSYYSGLIDSNDRAVKSNEHDNGA